MLEGKNPLVIGRLGSAPDLPTVTFYGHYDVQPALEPDWRTPPFELNSVNEYLYGRGTSDNKVRVYLLGGGGGLERERTHGRPT